MLVVYEGDGEVIITTPDQENETVKVWFIEGGRELNEYDRTIYPDEAVAFSSRVVRN